MSASVSPELVLPEITTPSGRGGLFAALLGGQTLPRIAAGLGVWLARMAGGPLQIGNTLFAARHVDAEDVLRRDLVFRIAPINAERIEAVNGPFVLGMDRGSELEVERRILYQALGEVDLDQILAQSAAEADRLLSAAGNSIDTVSGFARIVAGHTAQALFGISHESEALFLEVARAIFAHTFLNLGGDEKIKARAVRAAELMAQWFREEIKRRRKTGEFGSDMMGGLLRLSDDDELVRRTLGGMFVGSVDTTASAVAKVLAVLAKSPKAYAEASRRPNESDAIWHARLAGWYFEALRVWPHNPVVLREATADTTLGETKISKGARVFVWTQAAMQDSGAFPEPKRMDPDRPKSAYLHFGGVLHPCAGRAVNDRQIPMLVGKLLDRKYRITGRMQWAGPFPDHLLVTIEGPVAIEEGAQ